MFHSTEPNAFAAAIAAPPPEISDHEAMRRAAALREEAMRSRRLACSVGCSRARNSLIAFAHNNDLMAELIDPLRSPYS
jgi:hypothetical protein